MSRYSGGKTLQKFLKKPENLQKNIIFHLKPYLQNFLHIL